MTAPNSERSAASYPALPGNVSGRLGLILFCAFTVPAAADYGVLDMSGHRHAQFIYDQPRVARTGTEGEAPLYLHVPRDHSKQWSRYCHLYEACARPAWFVSEEWYYGVYLGRARHDLSDPEDAELKKAMLEKARKQ